MELITFDVTIWSEADRMTAYTYRITWNPKTRYNGVIDEAIRLFTLDTNDSIKMPTDLIEIRELSLP